MTNAHTVAFARCSLILIVCCYMVQLLFCVQMIFNPLIICELFSFITCCDNAYLEFSVSLAVFPVPT